MAVRIRCPHCYRTWPNNCEQAICIELYGACIVCRFSNSMNWAEAADLDAIQQERLYRLNKQKYAQKEHSYDADQ